MAGIKRMVKKAANSYRTFAQNKRFHKSIIDKIKTADIPIRNLTTEEKRSIYDYWIKYGVRPDYSTFQWYFSVNDIIDPRYISEGVYTNYIWTVLNDMSRCKGLNDKNLLDLFYYDAKMPQTVFHNINGQILSDKYQIIDLERAFQLAEQEDKVVIKPAVDSCQGNGIICVSGKDIRNAIKQYTSDYIVQKVIQQHPTFSALNDSSVNVVRMTSLLIDDEVYILDSIIRVGAPGSFTDHKNVAIGINQDGSLKEYGYTVKGKKVAKLANGYSISGCKLYGYSEMVETVKKLHPRTPQARLIGWDLTTDIDGNVVIIEANMDFPGIGRGQDCNGPFFGEYTDRVLDIVFNKCK